MRWSTGCWDKISPRGRLAPPDLRFGARAADPEGKGDLECSARVKRAVRVHACDDEPGHRSMRP